MTPGTPIPRPTPRDPSSPRPPAPSGGTRHRRRPSPAVIRRRRLVAVALLALVLVGAGWLGASLVDALRGGDDEPVAEQGASLTERASDEAAEEESGEESSAQDGAADASDEDAADDARSGAGDEGDGEETTEVAESTDEPERTEDERTEEEDADGAEDDDASSGEDAATEDGTAEDEPEPRRTETVGPEDFYPPVSEASSDPDSIHVLVNRLNPLDPLDHQPDDLTTPQVRSSYDGMLLREQAADALAELFSASDAEGLLMTLTSAYRSYGYQQQLYDGRAAELGVAGADEYTARPGHSEHQTGLAADVIAYDNPTCGMGACFGDTAEGIWLAENAHRFGFIIRYQEGTEDITGYAYEPWHLRYVGEETAEAVFEAGVTLEEYWGEPAAPRYPGEE
ncbi:M15 family metallopeptidase [Nesterenkonia sp. CL21]|uniref:M15 family metallopeptidase n=1 Tax=Nesterenkonia sp. CL21 TaxID=3064894 RepID=UPI0028786224|nr:M15 family metallopeptidase [Nesterenkonia sp. CL21]MDS2172077.1 M15 family metallopeptidase [Nesterenkonia sp. CL21]